VVTTVVNFEEQMRGWMAALRQARSFQAEVQVYARLLAHLDTFRRMTVLEFDDVAAIRAHELRTSRLPIGHDGPENRGDCVDARGRTRDRNHVDFDRVPDLRIEDWSRRFDPGTRRPCPFYLRRLECSPKSTPASSKASTPPLRSRVDHAEKAEAAPRPAHVGLPDTSVKESVDASARPLQQRLRLPSGHLVINLAPADLRKEGNALELPIALGSSWSTV